VSEVIGNSFDKFLRGNWQLLQIAHICQRVANTLKSVARGGYPPKQCFQRLLDNLYRYLEEGCPINKERGNLFSIDLKKLKVAIKIQEAPDSFKRFIF
jgi:hypothetical protein